MAATWQPQAIATGTGTQIENGKNWLDLSVTNSGEGAKIPATQG